MASIFEHEIQQILGNPSLTPDDQIAHLRMLQVRRSGRTTREVDLLVQEFLATGKISLPNSSSSEAAHFTRVFESRLARECRLEPRKGYYKQRYSRSVKYDFYDPIDAGKPFPLPTPGLVWCLASVDVAVQSFFTDGWFDFPKGNSLEMQFLQRLNHEHNVAPDYSPLPNNVHYTRYRWDRYDAYQNSLRQIRAEIARLSALTPKTSPL